MTFVKLDCGILDSSLWLEPASVVKVFITMLAMCRADGVVEATAPGISRRACLPLTTVRHALETLEAPDPDDKSGVEGGRRVRRVDGGYLVVNYLSYRNKDHTNAERQRRHRERNAVTSRPETVTSRPVTQAYVEAEVEGDVEGKNERQFSTGLSEEQRREYADAVWAKFMDKAQLPATRLASPTEFAVLKGWMDSGIPLRIVLRGIEDTKGKGSSLAYYANSVRDAFAYWRKAAS